MLCRVNQPLLFHYADWAFDYELSSITPDCSMLFLQDKKSGSLFCIAYRDANPDKFIPCT